jgi:ribose-phosphate pyrophosphokinase
LTVVSPDVGGVKTARAYAETLGAQLAIVAKHRVSATKVEAMNVIGDVANRDVLLVDDMTETAGTLCAAAEILKKNGAKRVFATVTHGVLGDMARERLANSVIERVLTTDTVPQAHGPKVDTVSVGNLLAQAVKRIHDGESVSSLFDI